MRIPFLSFLMVTGFYGIGQQIDSVKIPPRVVYKYSDPATVEKAKTLLRKELSDSTTYNLDNGIVFIGPMLWSRYKKIPVLESIPGGNVTIMFNKENLSAKVTQDKDGFKKIWDQVRMEVRDKAIQLRKATSRELEYYWAVISFDIEEPLLIAETAEHRYIINLSPKELKLVWLDEVPAGYR